GPCSARSMLRVSDRSSHPSSPKSRRCFRRRKLFSRPSVPDRSHTSTAYSTFAMAFLLLGHRLDGRPLRPHRAVRSGSKAVVLHSAAEPGKKAVATRQEVLRCLI